MYCATFAIANGSTATKPRSTSPHVTTHGPESQRTRRTGGTLRSARRRSSHGLWGFRDTRSLILAVRFFIVSAATKARRNARDGLPPLAPTLLSMDAQTFASVG